MTIDGEEGTVSRIAIEFDSAGLAARDPAGTAFSDVIVEMTQQWTPAQGSGAAHPRRLHDRLQTSTPVNVRYVIRKRVGNRARTNEARALRSAFTEPTNHAAYFTGDQEPFAMLHRGT